MLWSLHPSKLTHPARTTFWNWTYPCPRNSDLSFLDPNFVASVHNIRHQSTSLLHRLRRESRNHSIERGNDHNPKPEFYCHTWPYAGADHHFRSQSINLSIHNWPSFSKSEPSEAGGLHRPSAFCIHL